MGNPFESSDEDPIMCAHCGGPISECICVDCEECEGTGQIEDLDDQYTCPICKGSGVMST